MKLVLLDRDGVINFDSADYIKSPEEWRPIPGSLEAIARLNRAKIKVALISNQAGVGRGLFSLAMLDSIHQRMKDRLAEHDAHLDAIYFCPHHPDEDCHCRKPEPGMIEQALADFNLSSEDTVFVGDSYKDIQAAHAAGCKPALVLTGNGQNTQSNNKVDHIDTYLDLADFVEKGI
jgi:D-glycero-D-manno-heptose 1,7-bisphosphate phosphatase